MRATIGECVNYFVQLRCGARILVRNMASSKSIRLRQQHMKNKIKTTCDTCVTSVKGEQINFSENHRIHITNVLAYSGKVLKLGYCIQRQEQRQEIAKQIALNTLRMQRVLVRQLTTRKEERRSGPTDETRQAT